jgi:enoyl-CoA hydratase/carnithine racemase
MQAILNRLEDLPIPVVAAVNGPAVGGGSELALACDARVMAEDAYLSFAQARLGVVTGWGGGGRLIQILGRRRALTLLATAGRVEADRAEIMGLADWLAPPGRALERAEALVERMAELPPLAVRALKPLLRRVDCSDRAASQEAESEAFARLWGTDDHTEALAALLQGRPPEFTGS